jgi:hypothetical protein
MTDEEKLAERYVNGIPIFAEEGEGFSRTQMQKAFLAGLKAGSPKWHKVADGDLPKNENDVLIYSGEEWRMCIGRYSPKNKAWEAGCDTVAWCEIPEYKGK